MEEEVGGLEWMVTIPSFRKFYEILAIW